MINHYRKLLVDNTSKEHWRSVPNYSRYQVSSYGRVRNAKQVMKLSIGKRTQYLSLVLIGDDGKKHTCFVHRLVAQAFLENPYPDILIYVNHLDENKLNNRADNLEWCTAKYNYNYGSGKLRARNNMRLSSIQRGKTKSIVVYDLFDRLAWEFNSTREASRILKINNSNMGMVLKSQGKKLVMNKRYTLFYKADWSYEQLSARVRKINDSHRTPKGFVAINLSTRKETHYNTMREAANSLGFPHQAISRCLYGKQVSTHGYSFKLDSPFKIPNKLPVLLFGGNDYTISAHN